MSEIVKCPVCNGDGRVFRMTASYESVVTAAAGGTFSWTGPTYEWRTCHLCDGSGVVAIRFDASVVPLKVVPPSTPSEPSEVTE